MGKKQHSTSALFFYNIFIWGNDGCTQQFYCFIPFETINFTPLHKIVKEGREFIFQYFTLKMLERLAPLCLLLKRL